MKTNAIISAIICFILAGVILLAAIAQVSFIGALIGIALALMGRSFYKSAEAI